MRNISLILTMLFLAGCSTFDQAEIATASAILLAVPAAPVTYGIGYPIAVRSERKLEAFRKKSTPFYVDKTERIKLRDPIKDAQRAWENTGLTYLSSVKDGDYYPGIGFGEYLCPETELKSFIDANQTKIESDIFLSQIFETLTYIPDEYAPTHGYSEAIKEYLGIRFEYLKAFNQHMYRTSKSGKGE